MRVRVSDIPPRGLPIDAPISLEALNQRMQTGRGNDIVFLTPPRVEVLITRTPSGAESKGKISSRYRQPCSLCSEEKERDIEVEANFIFKEKPIFPPGDDIDQHFEDGIGIYHYENDHVELEEIAQEALILSLSLYWRPPLDCSGKCSLCSKQIEVNKSSGKAEGQNLGSLLSKALQKSVSSR